MYSICTLLDTVLSPFMGGGGGEEGYKKLKERLFPLNFLCFMLKQKNNKKLLCQPAVPTNLPTIKQAGNLAELVRETRALIK